MEHCLKNVCTLITHDSSEEVTARKTHTSTSELANDLNDLSIQLFMFGRQIDVNFYV